jgi:hypothetical protein
MHLNQNRSSRFEVREHGQFGIGENARNPGAPTDPLVVGNQRRAAEIAGVGADEFEVFPSDINGEATPEAGDKMAG